MAEYKISDLHPNLQRQIEMIPFCDCWFWAGRISRHGYGRYKLIYQQLVKVVPYGMHLDHLCRNKLCVNPNHLDIVTPQENQKRKSIATNRTKMCYCPRVNELTNEGGLSRDKICKNMENPKILKQCFKCKECEEIYFRKLAIKLNPSLANEAWYPIYARSKLLC